MVLSQFTPHFFEFCDWWKALNCELVVLIVILNLCRVGGSWWYIRYPCYAYGVRQDVCVQRAVQLRQRASCRSWRNTSPPPPERLFRVLCCWRFLIVLSAWLLTVLYTLFNRNRRFRSLSVWDVRLSVNWTTCRNRYVWLRCLDCLDPGLGGFSVLANRPIESIYRFIMNFDLFAEMYILGTFHNVRVSIMSQVCPMDLVDEWGGAPTADRVNIIVHV